MGAVNNSFFAKLWIFSKQGGCRRIPSFPKFALKKIDEFGGFTSPNFIFVDFGVPTSRAGMLQIAWEYSSRFPHLLEVCRRGPKKRH